MAHNYDVFLSYRHKPLDGEITQKTFQFLERYRLPKSLREQGFRPIERVFRDTEELAVSRILTHTIDEALRSADFLIIICSPYTPESEWVDREVMTFTEMGKADHIYPLLVAGSPEQSFTRTLKTIPDIMDRVMDVRSPGDDPKAVMKKAEKELLRVVAAVAGCSAERLRKADSMRSSKQMLTRGITAAAVFGAVALGSIGLWNQAESFRQEAAAAQRASMTIFQELTYSLPSRLENLPGTYVRLADVLKANAEQITDILKLSGENADVRYEIGANYSKLATAYKTIGNLSEAEEALRLALAEYEANNDGSPYALSRIAEAYNDLGNTYVDSGSYEEAEQAFSQAIELQKEVPDGESALAQYTGNAGVVLLAEGKTQAGTDLLAEALGKISSEQWTDDRQQALFYLQYCNGLRQLMEYEKAEEAIRKSIALYEDLYTQSGQARNILDGMLGAKMQLAWCMTDTGRYAEAAELYAQLLPLSEELAEDAENVGYLETKIQVCSNYANALNLCEDWSGSYKQYMNMALACKKLMDKTGTSSAQAMYAQALVYGADNAFSAGDYDLSERTFRKGLDVYSEVYEELGNYHTAYYLAYLSFTELVFDGNVEAAELDAWDALQLYGSVVTYAYSGTMCMYAGDLDLADEIFTVLIEAGSAEPIRQLFTALTDYGMPHEHMSAVLNMMNG